MRLLVQPLFTGSTNKTSLKDVGLTLLIRSM